MNNTLKKVLIKLISIAIGVAITYVLITSGTGGIKLPGLGGGTQGWDDVLNRTKLYTPINLSYDKGMLDWGDVQYADYYTVDIDGKEIEVDDSCMSFLPEQEIVNIKVQANTDNAVEYEDSAWSESLTIETDMSKVSVSTINAILSDVAGVEITNIASMEFKMGRLIIDAEGTVTRDDACLRIEYVDKKSKELNSLEDIIDSYENKTLYAFFRQYDFCSTSIMDTVIKSGKATSIQNYIDQGYEYSIVCESVRKIISCAGRIDAVIKVQLNDDVKFLSVGYEVVLWDKFATKDFKTNFEEYGQNLESYEIISEEKSVILEGEFLDYYEELAGMAISAEMEM